MADTWTREEERSLRRAVAEGMPLVCPVCDVRLEVETVAPRRDVSYVRRRRWLRCSRCRRSLVVDAPREEGA